MSSPYLDLEDSPDPNDRRPWSPQAPSEYEGTIDPIFIDGAWEVTPGSGTPMAQEFVNPSDIENHTPLETNDIHQETRNQLRRQPVQFGQTSSVGQTLSYLDQLGGKRARAQEGHRQLRHRPSCQANTQDVTSTTQDINSKSFHNDEQALFLNARQQPLYNDELIPPDAVAQGSARKNFTPKQKAPLVSWYQDHVNYPYPSPIEMRDLANQTGLETGQVQQWFINTRKRNKKQDERSSQPSKRASASASITFARSEASGGARDTAVSEFGHSSPNTAFPYDIGNGMDSPSFMHGSPSCESSSSLENWIQTSPKNDSNFPLTIKNLQNDNQPPRFQTRKTPRSEFNLVPRYITNPQETTFLEENVNSIDPRASLLCTDNERKSTNKKGKQIIPRRYSPERQENKKFQCTGCNKGFSTRDSWKRHEDSACFPLKNYICRCHEPRSKDYQGNVSCVFCGLGDPSDRHMDEVHKINTCLQKDGPQVFTRSDLANRHFMDIHRASSSWPDSWIVPVVDRYKLEQSRWCGFCEKGLDDRGERFRHVGNHFNDSTADFDMTRWKPYYESLSRDAIKRDQPSDQPVDDGFYFSASSQASMIR